METVAWLHTETVSSTDEETGTKYEDAHLDLIRIVAGDPASLEKAREILTRYDPTTDSLKAKK